MTRGNIFFLIKGLREHEIIELAFLKLNKGGGNIEYRLRNNVMKTNEEWYHQNLHLVGTKKLIKELEEDNLPLLKQHLIFMEMMTNGNDLE